MIQQQQPNPIELLKTVKQIIANFEISEEDLIGNSYFKTVTDKMSKEIAKDGKSQG